jgi:hypothetical protein
MKSSVGFAVFFWTAIGFPTHGVSQTTYAVGVGKDLCGTYLNHVGAASARSVGRTGPDDELDYYSKSATDLEWLLGFVTGTTRQQAARKSNSNSIRPRSTSMCENGAPSIQPATFSPLFVSYWTELILSRKKVHTLGSRQRLLQRP